MACRDVTPSRRFVFFVGREQADVFQPRSARRLAKTRIPTEPRGETTERAHIPDRAAIPAGRPSPPRAGGPQGPPSTAGDAVERGMTLAGHDRNGRFVRSTRAR